MHKAVAASKAGNSSSAPFKKQHDMFAPLMEENIDKNQGKFQYERCVLVKNREFPKERSAYKM